MEVSEIVVDAVRHINGLKPIPWYTALQDDAATLDALADSKWPRQLGFKSSAYIELDRALATGITRMVGNSGAFRQKMTVMNTRLQKTPKPC